MGGERDVAQINIYGKYCYENLNFCNNFNFSCDRDSILTCFYFSDYFKYIENYYGHIINVLQTAATKSSCSNARKQRTKIIGWNYHVRDSHQVARLHFSCWVMAGRPSVGETYNMMRESRAVFKNKVKWCQKNE